jgi:hypothetical protein
MRLSAIECELAPWVLLVLVACASSKPHERPPERQLSAYESHWLPTCGESGRTGECPAKRDVHFVVRDERAAQVSLGSPPRGATVPDAVCPWIERAHRVRSVLGPIEVELGKCFAGTTWGTSWVKYAWPLSSPVQHEELGNVSARAATCVDRILDRTPIGLDLGDAHSLFVMFGHEAPGHHGYFGSAEAPVTPVDNDPTMVGRCYQATMKVWPTLAGSHIAELVVAADGSVSVVRTVGGTLDNPALGCCINTAVRRWKYTELPAESALRVFRHFHFRQQPPPAKR